MSWQLLPADRTNQPIKTERRKIDISMKTFMVSPSLPSNQTPFSESINATILHGNGRFTNN